MIEQNVDRAGPSRVRDEEAAGGARVLAPWSLLVCGLVLAGGVCSAQADMGAEVETRTLTDLSLAELAETRVVTVSKAPRRLLTTPAAVSVVTQEDIRRSGASSVMDALRMVPGVHVAQLNTDFWSVSLREFNRPLSNKALVLIDGRSVYSPLFSNVFWREHDLILADVERIEVIRGPGGTIWGANAVNGTINIVTKRAADTQGALVTAEGGDRNGGSAFRYGGRLGSDMHYRVYVKAFQRDRLFSPSSATDAAQTATVSDHWQSARWGGRLDWQPSASDFVCIEGSWFLTQSDNLYSAVSLGPPEDWAEDTERTTGGFLRGQWERALSGSTELVSSFYIDHQDYDIPAHKSRQTTFDVDSVARMDLYDCHALSLGLGYRLVRDDFDSHLTYRVTPESYDRQLFSAFLKDEMRLMDGRVILTVGAKVEHNDFTGFEVQPTLRALALPAERQAVWVSATRAVRTPNRTEQDVAEIQLNSATDDALAELVIAEGVEDYKSERVTAYELGYRLYLSDSLWGEVAGFYNEYDDVVSFIVTDEESALQSTVFESVVSGIDEAFSTTTVRRRNLGQPVGQGVEFSAGWRLCSRWSLHPAYSYLDLGTWLYVPGDGGQIEIREEHSEHRFSLRSMLNVTDTVQLDVWVRHLEDVGDGPTRGYTSGDVRLAYVPSDNLELAVTAQNVLFDGDHEEYVGYTVSDQVLGQLTYRF